MKWNGIAVALVTALGMWASPAFAVESGLVWGQITDSDGKPLAGWVTFPESDQPAAASSPGSGEFELSLPIGSYLAEFSADGYASVIRPVRVRSGKPTYYDIQLVKETPTALLRGELLTGDGAPIVGVLSFISPERDAIAVNPETGSFQDRIVPGIYKVKASAAGYENVETEFTAKPLEEIELQVVLAPREGLNKVELTEKAIEIKEKILFASGKHEVLFTSYPVLDEIFIVLTENAGIRLSIEGHTDSVGGAETNLKLSQLRAEAVRQYLVDRGISEDRLTAIGFGLESPLDSNETPEGREKNRRVEFNIVTQ